MKPTTKKLKAVRAWAIVDEFGMFFADGDGWPTCACECLHYCVDVPTLVCECLHYCVDVPTLV